MPLNTLFVRLDLGATASCALDAGGAAWCWGGDFNGVLGNGPANESPAPSRVVMPGDFRFATVACHFYSCCAAGTAGGLWCWGGNGAGQLGDGTKEIAEVPIPVQDPGL